MSGVRWRPTDGRRSFMSNKETNADSYTVQQNEQQRTRIVGRVSDDVIDSPEAASPQITR